MEYLVMECGLSYAVVLDSEGRFLKVPNLGYEVGQTLNSVVLQDAPSQPRPLRKHLARWAAMAACLCIMVIGSWSFWQSPVGTVRMQINPDVQMSVNRFDRVVRLEGLNEDGEDLIEGYHAYGKGMQTVSDELADRAVDLGYLSDGGRITLTVESDRASWKTATEELLLLELDVHFEHRVIVVTVSSDEPEVPDEPSKDMDTIVIQPGQFPPEQADDDDDDQYEEDDREDEADDDWNDDVDDDRSDSRDDDDDNADDRDDDDADQTEAKDGIDDDDDPGLNDDDDDGDPEAPSLEYEDDRDEENDASDDADTSDDSDSDGTTSDSDDADENDEDD